MYRPRPPQLVGIHFNFSATVNTTNNADPKPQAHNTKNKNSAKISKKDTRKSKDAANSDAQIMNSENDLENGEGGISFDETNNLSRIDAVSTDTHTHTSHTDTLPRNISSTDVKGNDGSTQASHESKTNTSSPQHDNSQDARSENDVEFPDNRHGNISSVRIRKAVDNLTLNVMGELGEDAYEKRATSGRISTWNLLVKV
jgi:hypothetical protein